MIGFEAELSVPTFEDSRYQVQGQQAEAILTFLFGGFENTDLVAGANEFFKIKPDVSDYQRAGQKILGPLSGFVEVGSRKSKDVRITKMEYETHPVDEAADDANDKFTGQAAAIKEHSESFFARARAGIVPVPPPAAAGMHAGVPVAQIQTVVNNGLAHDHPRARELAGQLSEATQALLAGVIFEFALQATAGIAPSAIPTLFERETKPLDRPVSQLAEASLLGYPLLREFVDTTMTTTAWIQEEITNNETRAAFKGHLYLIASYLLGEALTQTSIFKSMSAKNAVPYHAKINLGDFYLAAPLLPEVPQPVAAEIFRKLNSKEWTKSDFWVENLKVKYPKIEKWDNPEHLVFGGSYGFVVNALCRGRARTFINQRGLYLSDEKKREHAEPDKAPTFSNNERGIQLEFRRLGAVVGPEGLGQAFLDVVKEVRMINLSYLAPEVQQRVRGLMEAAEAHLADLRHPPHETTGKQGRGAGHADPGREGARPGTHGPTPGERGLWFRRGGRCDRSLC
jgi:hypothetical protein